jgi:hypothetical protein
MLDRNHWTAAMLLHWVLNRDEAALQVMADAYGVVAVFDDGTVSDLPGPDIDAVLSAYCGDSTLPPTDERLVTAVVRSEHVIAAKQEIISTLLDGVLTALARRNGTGDVETIAPSQWLGLKFRSWSGHDFAVPTDINGAVLDLPASFEDYARGRVPSNVLPVVWPNPLFSEMQARQIWPSRQVNKRGLGAVPRIPHEWVAAAIAPAHLAPINLAGAEEAAPQSAKQKRRPGPQRGTVDRYSKADRALFPELEELIRSGEAASISAAATMLAGQRKIAGSGLPENNAKRLAERFREEHPTVIRRNSP